MNEEATAIPTPPWRKARRATPVKPQLSQELIVETGLRVLDAEGLDALSMRRIAQELDTGPASLYAHVAGKDELLELIYDRVMGEVRLPERDPANWRRQVREYAREAHRVLAAHSDIAKVALASIPTGPNMLRLAEFVFGLLIEAGFSPRDASLGMDRLSLYVSSDAYEGSLHYARMRDSGMELKEYFRHFVGQIDGFYRALPPDRFPHLAANVDALIADGGEARFEYGLDLVIAGLEARPRDPA